MKILFTTILTYFFITASIAQINKNKFEIKANAGYLSDAHFALAINNSIDKAFFGGNSKVISSGIYSADALIRIGNSKLLAEITYGYEEIKIKYEDYAGVPNVFYINNFLGGIQYNYLEKNKGCLYSGLQLGVRTKREVDYSESSFTQNNETKFDYDLTAIGVRYGTKAALFLEYGFGAKGLVRAGLSLKFKTKKGL